MTFDQATYWMVIILLVVIAILIRMRLARASARKTPPSDNPTLRVMEVTRGIDGTPVYAGIARLIRDAQDEKSLRLFACSCAEFAMERSGLDGRELLDAVEVGRALAEHEVPAGELEHTRSAVKSIEDRLDEAALALGEDEETGKPAQEGYSEAFSLARAASSVLACLGKSPRTAAAEACYGALSAVDDVDAVTRIAQEILR